VIRFDFDDRYVFERPEPALPWFLRVLIADAAFWVIFAFFILPWIVIAYLLWPHREIQAQAPPDDHTPIVFMQPAEIPRALLRPQPSVTPKPEAKPPDHIVLPGNTKPFEAGDPPAPQPAQKSAEPPPPEPPRPEPESQIARNSATPPPVPTTSREEARPPVAGVLGRALQNLDRYAALSQTPANPLGGATDPGSAEIQFDRKGVNFDPWLRRFVSQVRRNWFVPQSAMMFKGHVVLQFTIHKDGRITDVRIARRSDVDSFNRAAFNAIIGSNPTEPFPAEFPDEAAPFTVTFFYNEQPPN
jgi:TonB family protein